MLKIKQQENKDLSIIGKSLTIKGDIESIGSVDIIGNFVGDGSFNILNIREFGSVNGKITAEHTTINGQMDGDLIVETLIINKTAIINGTIKYKTIAIEDGAILNCKIEQKS